jgi:hypothetical protein
MTTEQFKLHLLGHKRGFLRHLKTLCYLEQRELRALYGENAPQFVAYCGGASYG